LALDDIEFRACWPTIASLVASATLANLCINNNFTLSSTISAGYNSAEYQWQESTDQVNWTNISGASALTYNGTITVAGIKYYSMLASEAGNINNSTCRVASNVLTINGFNYPSPPVAPTTVEYCQNASAVPLTATPTTGGTLNWYTASSGGVGTSSLTPVTANIGNTTYYVSQTVNGCESQTRTAINVIVSTNPKFTVTTANSCFNSGTATFTTNGNTGGNWTVTGGGTITSAGVFTPTA
jgi:Ig-like domain CHU_C associated